MTSTPQPEGCPAHASSGLMPISATTMTREPRKVIAKLRRDWGNVAQVELEPGVPAWLVLGYREVLTVARRENLYSRDARNWRLFQDGTVAPDSALGPMMFWRPNVIGADGAEHRRLRRPLDDGVASIDQRRMRRSVEELCTFLVSLFVERGNAELVTEYSMAVPLLSMASLFGLDPEQSMELVESLKALFGSAEDAQEGNRRFETLLRTIVRARAENPADDLTTRLLNHPDLRGEDEVMQSMAIMISAGQEGTTDWISQSLRLMLTDSRFVGRMRGGRLGVDDALDEVLWLTPPISNLPARYALSDTELAGQRIMKGDALILGIAGANEDPTIRGGESSMEQGNRAHLAWSAGPHACPARVPARLIAHTAVKTALHLLPDIRLTIPADEIATNPSPWMTGPKALPVSFTASRTPLAMPT